MWGALNGLAVALGPLLGGAITQGASWQTIFWLNVPIGLLLTPIAALRLAESYGPARRLDGPGVALVAVGLTGVVLGLVRGGEAGWTSPTVVASFALGAGLLVGFVLRERSTAAPVLPLGLFRSRGFRAVNAAALLMSAGMFGSIFLLAQFLQTVQGYSPLSAGLRTLPWTAVPVLVAPIAGPLSDRLGGRPLITLGLALQALGLGWMALILSPTTSFTAFLGPFIASGIGMSLFFVPVANVVMGSVPPEMQGVASGTNNALREVGGVLGVAVLAAVFVSQGGYASGASFVAGLRPALWVGAVALAVGTLAASRLPRRQVPAAALPAGGPLGGPADVREPALATV